MREIHRFGIIAAVVTAAACASAGNRSARSGCSLSARDSTYLTRGPVYRDCAVDERAKATATTTNARIDFQPQRSDNGCFTAEVEFVVDTLGVPEQGTQRLVRATTPSFGEAVLAVVPSFRYEPARRAGVRVRQIVSERRTAVVGTIVVARGSAPPPPMRGGGSAHVPNC